MKTSARFFLAVCCIAAPSLSLGQENTVSGAPQNARQALLDMFFGKPGSLEKHLPEATRAALRQASASGPPLVQQLSAASSQLNMSGNHLQTFETGSTLLSVENSKALTKFEVVVDQDDLVGDEDNIQLSFHAFKNGQPEKAPVLPALTFSMKQENSIWRLSAISLTVKIALDNPALLKLLVEAGKARQLTTISGTGTVVRPNITGAGFSPLSRSPAPNPALLRADELSAIASMRSILTAEMTYAATYASVGYTCSLSDLDGFGQGTPNEHQAMLIESRLASGKKRGYLFTLTGCATGPSPRFQLTAVPLDNASGLSFCSDESGSLRSASDPQPASCFSHGTPLP